MLMSLNPGLLRQAPHFKLPAWDVHPIDESLWTPTVAATSTKRASLSKSRLPRKEVDRQLERVIQVSLFLRIARTKCFLFLPWRSWQIKTRLEVLAEQLLPPQMDTRAYKENCQYSGVTHTRANSTECALFALRGLRQVMPCQHHSELPVKRK